MQGAIVTTVEGSTKNRTVTGPNCGEYEGRFEDRENIGGGSAPSGTEEDEAAGRNDFARERGEMQREQDRGQHYCRGELPLTPCSVVVLEAVAPSDRPIRFSEWYSGVAS